MLERRGRRDAESEVRCRCRHSRHEKQRVVHRDLGSCAQRRLRSAAVYVVDAEHVGDEEAVEQAALEQFGEVGPVLEILITRGLRLGVSPRAGHNVGDAVHVERVEVDLTGHDWPPRAGSGSTAGRLVSSRRVYGSRGVSNISVAVPDSTTPPSRITRTRSATWWMTLRSCEMNR